MCCEFDQGIASALPVAFCGNDLDFDEQPEVVHVVQRDGECLSACGDFERRPLFPDGGDRSKPEGHEQVAHPTGLPLPGVETDFNLPPRLGCGVEQRSLVGEGVVLADGADSEGFSRAGKIPFRMREVLVGLALDRESDGPEIKELLPPVCDRPGESEFGFDFDLGHRALAPIEEGRPAPHVEGRDDVVDLPPTRTARGFTRRIVSGRSASDNTVAGGRGP